MTHDFQTVLEDRLQTLAESAPPPPLAAADDVERGRRGLVRRRAAVGAAALATAAVVTVGAVGVTAGSDDAGPDPAAPGPSTTATDPVSPSPSPTPAEPVDRRNGKQLLTDWAKALARHLDPSGGHLQTRPDNYQGGGGLGTKLGWSVPGEDGLGMVEIFVGRGAFAGSFGPSCDRISAPCDEVTVRGVEMRVQRIGDTTAVYHVQDDGDRVWLYLDPLFGNNSLVPVESLDFPLRTLAAAVSDPAFTTPTRQQVDGASASFGWPDPGIPGTPGASASPR